MDTGRLGGSCSNPGETAVGQRGGRSGSVYSPVPRARLSSAIRTRTPDAQARRLLFPQRGPRPPAGRGNRRGSGQRGLRP